MDWVKFDPARFLEGTVELTDAECAIYIKLICAMYCRNGSLRDEERFICCILRCRPQKWRRVRARLLAKGKIHLETDGKLVANRVKTALKEYDNFTKTQSSRAKNRWKSTDDECHRARAQVDMPTQPHSQYEEEPLRGSSSIEREKQKKESEEEAREKRRLQREAHDEEMRLYWMAENAKEKQTH